MKQFFLPVVAIVAFLAGGCSSVTPLDGARYSEVPASKVEVLYKEPKREYDVIALVSHEAATRFATVPDVIQKCRELAAQAGADALIITTAFDQGSNSAARAAGRAIKWKK